MQIKIGMYCITNIDDRDPSSNRLTSHVYDT